MYNVSLSVVEDSPYGVLYRITKCFDSAQLDNCCTNASSLFFVPFLLFLPRNSVTISPNHLISLLIPQFTGFAQV